MPEQSRKSSWSVRRAVSAAAAVLAGLGLVLYPFLADILYEYRTEGVITALNEAAEDDAESEKIQVMLAQAESYNQRLRGEYSPVSELQVPEDRSPEEDEEYRSLLTYGDTGVMAYVSIPCIGVDLPVYHGSSEDVLEKGAGHLYGSSLPVGGPGTHTVITAHTGFGKARFFTDLTQMKEGDCFMITVPGRKLLYRTDRITIVKPEDTSLLGITAGKDYCTLLTCTPYGINSHRLLVRGERVKEETAAAAEELQEERQHSLLESEWIRHYLYSLLIACSVMTGAAAMITLFRRMRRV